MEEREQDRVDEDGNTEFAGMSPEERTAKIADDADEARGVEDPVLDEDESLNER